MKIAICTPVHTDTTATYSQCLARLFGHTLRERPDIDLDIMICRSSLLLLNRINLAEGAKQWGADFVLWLDADHFFPPDTLLRLLAHDRDIIGCNYPVRANPTGPSANGLDGKPCWTTPEKVQAGELEEVRTIGLGCCLVKMGVLISLPAPLFNTGITADGKLIGEDAHFCFGARKAGFQIWCDHVLSWHIGHVHERVMWNVDTLPDRERFMETWENGQHRKWV